MSLVFVYFLLSAQYESYILPLAVVLTIPLGVFGVMLFINLLDIENNIYVQVALIMLIGLLAKNAILIVEFAVQQRKAGKSIVEAALEGSRLRLRPILMTSFAFIVGMIPLMLASGGSALGNHSIGAGAVGGMLTGVVFGIFIIPVLYVIFQYLHELRFRKPRVNPLILLMFSAVFLASCRVNREYTPPAVELPQKFRSANDEYNTELTNDTANMPLPGWRQFFTDPDLRMIIDSVLHRNYDIQIAYNAIRMSDAVLKEAKAAGWPSVQADISAGTSRPSDNSFNGQNLQSFTGSSHIEDYTASVGLSWEIDIWDKNGLGKEAASANYLGSLALAQWLQTRLITSAASTYYHILALHEQLDIARRNRALRDSTLRIIRLQYESGEVSRLAVRQAQVQKKETEALIPELEQALQLRENALNILMAREPRPVAVRGNLTDFAVPGEFSPGIPAALLSHRPDVRESEYALQAANARTGIARTNLYPSLRITASGGFNAFKASQWLAMPASLFGNAAGGLVQPLFDRRRLKTDYELAGIQRENAVIRFRNTVMNAVREVSDALIQLDKLEEQISVAEEQEDIHRAAIPNAKQLFNNGFATYLEVLTAQQSALQNDLRLIDLKRRQINALILLYRSLGGDQEMYFDVKEEDAEF